MALTRAQIQRLLLGELARKRRKAPGTHFPHVHVDYWKNTWIQASPAVYKSVNEHIPDFRYVEYDDYEYKGEIYVITFGRREIPFQAEVTDLCLGIDWAWNKASDKEKAEAIGWAKRQGDKVINESDLFSQMVNQREDQMTVEQPESTEPKIESYQCAKCGRTFTTKQGLSMHTTRSHTRKRGKNVNKKFTRKAVTPATLDHAKALSVVAPGGFIPTHLIKRVAEWLDEGDKLVKLIAKK